MPRARDDAGTIHKFGSADDLGRDGPRPIPCDVMGEGVNDNPETRDPEGDATIDTPTAIEGSIQGEHATPTTSYARGEFYRRFEWWRDISTSPTARHTTTAPTEGIPEECTTTEETVPSLNLLQHTTTLSNMFPRLSRGTTKVSYLSSYTISKEAP